MKYLGELRYFLGIEVEKFNQGIFLSQKKYVLDHLKEFKMMQCKPLKLPMDPYASFFLTSVWKACFSSEAQSTYLVLGEAFWKKRNEACEVHETCFLHFIGIFYF